MTNDKLNETICAISTPPGVGGIAVCRVSGPEAIAICDTIWKGRRLESAATHSAHLGEVTDSRGDTLDQCVATLFRAPGSFTGEDVVEIAVHGSKYVQRELLNSLVKAGCRIAAPGEFTRRAFASGKMDLAEAEAVADIIASQSRAAHRIALNQMKGGFSRRLADLRANLVDLVALMELELDFSEEDVEFASRDRLLEIAIQISQEVERLHRSFASGSAIKDGIPVAIVGDTNAGKSSLLNLILGDDRAIVSDIQGTTRDTVEETIEIGDYTFRLIDTAGIRDTSDEIERIGIQRSQSALLKAHIVLWVSDVTSPINLSLMEKVIQAPHPVAVINKIDLTSEDAVGKFIAKLPHELECVRISALDGEGLPALKSLMANIIDKEGNADAILVTNARHAEALLHASDSIKRVIEGLASGLSGDLVSQDIRETIHHLATITGEIPSTEILSTIFSRFCIGK